MEVKKLNQPSNSKYRQTEVGLIPTDWDINNIGNVCQIFGRIGFRGYTAADIVGKGKGAITISPSNIRDNQMDFSNCTYISWFKYEESPEIKIFNGDILLVKTGSTFGKTALVINLNEKATINPQLVVLKNFLIDNSYLSYVMGFKIVQDQIRSTIVGGAIPTLSQQQISNFQIPLPPTLTEQRAIATALSDVDRLLSAYDQLIAKKKAIKLGAMQELLTGKRRLEGFEGEWEPVKLGEVLKVRHGKSQHEVSDKNGVYPILATGGQIGWANTFIYNRPSVLIGRKGTIDVPQYMDTPFWCVDTLFFTEVSDRAVPKFLFYRFCLINWYNYNEASGVPSLNASTIENIEIYFPIDKTEQGSIVSILIDMDAEITALEQQRDKYKAVKQGMMQELLTGRTRLV